MNSIVCPHCNKSFEPGDAIVHEITEKIKIEQKKEFEKEKRDLEEKIKLATQKEAQKEIEENKKENEKLEQQLLKLQKSQEENEKKIKEEAQKNANEHSKMEVLELKKQLDDTKKSLDEAKRKADQKSQQLQGEVLELDLEEKLKTLFPHDEFVPVPKGVEGGDIWQKVMFNGKIVGSILWETKRTKAWSNGWTVKLKDDAARISASEAIIVSVALPEGVTNFDRKDGVWITTYEHAINICRYVRFLITKVASIKSSAGQTGEEWGRVRDYMLSDSFKHRMQAHFDGIKALRDSLEAEKRSTMLRWKKQEFQLEKLDTNTTNFYGELSAIVPELPKVEAVSSSNDEKDTPDSSLL